MTGQSLPGKSCNNLKWLGKEYQAGKPGKLIKNGKSLGKTVNFNKNFKIWNDAIVILIIILLK